MLFISSIPLNKMYLSVLFRISLIFLEWAPFIQLICQIAELNGFKNELIYATKSKSYCCQILDVNFSIGVYQLTTSSIYGYEVSIPN